MTINDRLHMMMAFTHITEALSELYHVRQTNPVMDGIREGLYKISSAVYDYIAKEGKK